MTNNIKTETKTPAEKPATETPLMTEEQMNKFVSALSNNESIQSDYVFNGFLFLFQSINEVIIENPIEAQNLMLHLQQHIFNNLMWESFYAFDAHRKKAHLIFGKSEPYIYEETEQPGASDEPEVETTTEQPEAETLADHHLQIMANKISHILKSDKVSADAKDAFHSIIVDASNETKVNVGISNPEIIKISLPLLIKSLDFNYGRGIVQSLHSLLDSSLVYEIEDELQQYEKRFDGRTEEELRILDLSNSTVEDLARTLSGIMHNPNLPKPIKDCLEDNLNSNHIDFYSPENILGNLKESLGAEGE